MDLTRTNVVLADVAAMRALAQMPLRAQRDIEHLETLRQPHSRERFIAGRQLVTQLLDQVGLPEMTEVVPDADGRPVLSEPCGLSISITHSRRWVAAAIVEGQCCGVDVQDFIDPITLSPAVLSAFLPDGWSSRYQRSPVPGSELTRLWTIVETALKWRGTGFRSPLSELDFVLTPRGADVTDPRASLRTHITTHQLPGLAILAATNDSPGSVPIITRSLMPTVQAV